MRSLKNIFFIQIYIVALVDSIGLGLYLSLCALYLDKAINIPISKIGFVLGVAGIASMCGSISLVRIVYSYGSSKGLYILFTSRAIAFILLALINSLVGAIIASILIGFISRSTAPMIESALIEGEENNIAVNLLSTLRIVRNIGFATGGIPVGIIVWLGQPVAYKFAILFSALLFLIAALICFRLPSAKTHHLVKPRLHIQNVITNKRFMLLTIFYGLQLLSAILLSIGLPLWIINNSQAPHWTVGLIQLVNTILIIVLQKWASKGTGNAKTAIAHMKLGSFLAAIASIILIFGGLYGIYIDTLIVILVILFFTLAELFIVAGSEGLALLYMPSNQRVIFFAVFNLGFSATTIIGPPLVTYTITCHSWVWSIWSGLFVTLILLIHKFFIHNSRSI